MSLMKVTSTQRRRVKSLGPRRSMTHLLLGGMTIALFLLIPILIPRGKQGIFLVIVLGYLSLFLILVTLLIGPLNLLRLRRNPVNIDLRRDIGIWAGIAGCLHVLLVIRGTILNGQVLLYFLQRGCCGYTPLLNVYGISNDLGLFATLLLALLLALSNTVSLRVLKGKWWKRLQRLNYLLILLAVGHTLGFQYLNLRGPVLLALVILSIVIVLAAQGLGIVLTLSHRYRGS